MTATLTMPRPETQALPRPGDVLSYSAGSTQTGPFGFRRLKNRGGLLAATLQRWPDLGAELGSETPLFLNAYPAALGAFQGGISVDTYLSPRVLSRALQLGRLGDHPTILVAQPLFLADVLLSHLEKGFPLPRKLMLWTGGYPLPPTLGRMLRAALEPHVDRLWILQYFGAAEVDAACLMSRECDDRGRPIFYPRSDVRVERDENRLLLTLLDGDGSPAIEKFPTGDLVHPHGQGWTIENPARLHPDIARVFDSWTHEDWQRRTGYLARHDGDFVFQLRLGVPEPGTQEQAHFEFAHRFGFSWLDKPVWS